jgi:hypothetical protein
VKRLEASGSEKIIGGKSSIEAVGFLPIAEKRWSEFEDGNVHNDEESERRQCGVDEAVARSVEILRRTES